MHEEKKKAEEAEQEQRAKLLRSRNKKEEDPEREKKKKDAKLKQQELAEKQQLRQADQTALEASKRKRPTTTAVINDFEGLFLIFIEVINFTWSWNISGQ